jgi:hypothetical protein
MDTTNTFYPRRTEARLAFNDTQKVEELTEKVLDKLAEYIGQYRIALYSTVNVFYTELQKLRKKVKSGTGQSKNNVSSVDEMVNTAAHDLMDWASEGSIPNIRASLLIHAVACSLTRTWRDHLLDQASWYGKMYAVQLEQHTALLERLGTLRSSSHEKRWLSLYDTLQWDDEKINTTTRNGMRNWEPELSLKIKRVLRLSEWAWRPHKLSEDLGTPDEIVSVEVADLDKFIQTYLLGCDREEFMDHTFKIHENIIIHFAQYHTDHPPTHESLQAFLSKIKGKIRTQYYQYVAELTMSLGSTGHPDANSISNHVEELSLTLEQSSSYPNLWDVPSNTLTLMQHVELHTALTAEGNDDCCDWTETEDSDAEYSEGDDCEEDDEDDDDDSTEEYSEEE